MNIHDLSATSRLLLGWVGLIHLQKKPKQLPIKFITIAEVAAGSATAGEEKWEVAKTTAKAEFCMPTCKKSTESWTSLAAFIIEKG